MDFDWIFLQLGPARGSDKAPSRDLQSRAWQEKFALRLPVPYI
jgi:hypothetical protein